MTKLGREIERIPMPAREVFLRDYVHAHRPAIITNLFEGEAIRQVTALSDAMEAFGSALLPVRPEYTSSTPAAAIQTLSFNQYWRLVRAEPSTSLMCTEAEIPARLLSQFTLPQACKAESSPAEEILALPRKYGDHDLLLNAFVGNRGNVAHLHYDGDQREVLLYQVFGIKEVILFAPDRGIHLQPLNSLTFSGLSLQAMSLAERISFARDHGGYWGELRPGDAVYIPALFWHFLNYSEDSMSFNIRFGRNRRCDRRNHRRVCATAAHRGGKGAQDA
jgi:Cupin-like domain